MRPVSLQAVATAFPVNVVNNEFFGEEGNRPQGGMFRGARERRHLAPGQTAVDLIAEASKDLSEQVGENVVQDVDIILTNVSLPDLPFTGCGAEVAKMIGANPTWVYDLHNHGCVSFISMVQLAQMLISTTSAKRALICNVQTAAGRIFRDEQVRKLPQAAVPGDGCGLALVEEGDYRPIEGITVKCFSENASDMQIANGEGREWWEPGQEQFHIDFSRAKVARVVERGNQMVPQVVQEACQQAGISHEEIGTLITNQPNAIFLRNWRDALEVSPDQHVDTFEEHGNLFGAGIPVSLKRAMDEGVVNNGKYVVLGGFSHAGDYSAAAVIRWNKAA